MTDVLHFATSIQSSALQSNSKVAKHQAAPEVQSDTQGSASKKRRNEEPRSLQVSLSARALKRAANLEVSVVSDAESRYELQHQAISGEAEIIERKQNILMYRSNAEPIYANESIQSTLFDFFV